jgi:type VI secretion system protein ImpA
MSDALDPTQLSAPITAEQPCGESLEDTALLAAFDGYRVFGQIAMPDSPPDSPDPKPVEPNWREIKEASLAALAKSKDLRLLAHLGAATLRTDDLRAFFDVLRLAESWLETYWEHVYPLATEDVLQRQNALNCFADRTAIIEGLRRSPLLKSSQLGTLSLRDVEISTGQVTPGTSDKRRPDPAVLSAILAAAPLDELRAQKESTDEALIALVHIEETMRAKAGPEAVPTFDPLRAQVQRIQRLLTEQIAKRPEAASGDREKVSDYGDNGASSGQVASVGMIKSRQDAVRALDAVTAFFRQNEPSSPIPLVLERAKRLVAKDFLEVLADIAPGGVSQAKLIGGIEEKK